MKAAIDLLVRGQDVPAPMMREVMLALMQGEADPAAVGAFLTALTIKGETVAEVTAAAQVMRELAKPADLGGGVLVDPVGTGGDGASLFNVSTAAAIVASAGGVKIAKHGNVAASSASGSADVLRQAGVVVDLEPAQVKECIAETNFGFMFAQAYHHAMRHVVPVRRAIGIRTVFNVLGPLSNPAGVKHQMLGVQQGMAAADGRGRARTRRRAGADGAFAQRAGRVQRHPSERCRRAARRWRDC